MRVGSGKSVTVAFTTLVAATRAEAFELADRYHDPHAAQRALDLAWTVTQIDLRHAGIDSAQAAVFQEIAGHLIYAREALRPPPDELRRNQGSQSRLWTHGISGDQPILLAIIDAVKGLPTLRQLFAAHQYWRRRGLAVDLVVVIGQPHDYLQELRQAITDEMFAASGSMLVDQPGGVFIRRRDSFNPDDYLMLSATARVHIPCDGRPLSRIVPSGVTRTRPESEDTLVPVATERRVRPRVPVAPRGPARARRRPPGRQRPWEPRCRGRLSPPGANGPPAARTLGERHRQRAGRLPRHRAWRRLHLGGELLLLPPDPVAQRSGDGSCG